MKMNLPFSFIILRYTGDIEMTQNLLSLSITPGESSSVSCRSSQTLLHSDGNTDLNHLVHKPGQPPQYMIYKIFKCHFWVSDSFSGTGSGTDFTLKISSVEAKDIRVHYCIQAAQILPMVLDF
ncbi:Ig kappa chain V-II region TEW [Heterocephalus glaber]|nr:Ig kappa chain V-II region TEW [Heterocephalus glaber]